jgi:hypothetical protein
MVSSLPGYLVSLLPGYLMSSLPGYLVSSQKGKGPNSREFGNQKRAFKIKFFDKSLKYNELPGLAAELST